MTQLLTNRPELPDGELAATQAQLFEHATDLRQAVALQLARARELEQAHVDAVALARVLEWPDTQIENARLGGQLHDLGKLAVDDAILRKPGRLEEVEWEQM